VKANEGSLYPLEKGLLFVPKPPTLILYPEIMSIEYQRFSRSAGSARSFDVKVETDKGSHTFLNIAREEFQSLHSFFVAKNLPVPEDIEVSSLLSCVECWHTGSVFKRFFFFSFFFFFLSLLREEIMLRRREEEVEIH
jgi:hypothetical protein